MLAINRKVTIPGYVKAKSMVQAKQHSGKREPDKDLGEGDTGGRHGGRGESWAQRRGHRGEKSSPGTVS